MKRKSEKTYTKSEVDYAIKTCMDTIKERKVDLDYRKMIAQKNMEIDELKAKLKEQAKEIFDDIEKGINENAIFSFPAFNMMLRYKKKWVGKK